MADDTAVTDRLRQLVDETDDHLGGHTIVIDDMDIMATRELRQLSEAEVLKTDDNHDGDDDDEEWTWIS